MCWGVLTGRWAAFPDAELCDAHLSPRRTVSRNAGRTAVVCEHNVGTSTRLNDGRADYAGHGHNPRLVVHHETEVTIRGDKRVENVVGARSDNFQALQPDVGRQRTISATEDFPHANRTHVAKQDLTFFTSCKREHSDVRQISPDLLAVVYARLFHLLHESKGLRLRCHVGFHRFLPQVVNEVVRAWDYDEGAFGRWPVRGWS